MDAKFLGYDGFDDANRATQRYLRGDLLRPAPSTLPTKSSVDRHPLIREAFRLEWLTIGWMFIEAIVATAAGVASGSLVLVAFGLDSGVESISAGVLICGLS